MLLCDGAGIGPGAPHLFHFDYLKKAPPPGNPERKKQVIFLFIRAFIALIKSLTKWLLHDFPLKWKTVSTIHLLLILIILQTEVESMQFSDWFSFLRFSLFKMYFIHAFIAPSCSHFPHTFLEKKNPPLHHPLIPRPSTYVAHEK